MANQTHKIDPNLELVSGQKIFIRSLDLRTLLSLRPVAFLGLVAPLAFGQVGNGTITGVITDPAGAVVAGVSVGARNAETGVVFPAVSTNAGNYTITDLPVGTYELTVKANGFKNYTHTNLTVGAAQTLRQDVT